MNAYSIWSRKEQTKISETVPEMAVKDVVKLLGERWNKLTAEEKAPFVAEAEAEKTKNALIIGRTVEKYRLRKRPFENMSKTLSAEPAEKPISTSYPTSSSVNNSSEGSSVSLSTMQQPYQMTAQPVCFDVPYASRFEPSQSLQTDWTQDTDLLTSVLQQQILSQYDGFTVGAQPFSFIPGSGTVTHNSEQSELLDLSDVTARNYSVHTSWPPIGTPVASHVESSSSSKSLSGTGSASSPAYSDISED